MFGSCWVKYRFMKILMKSKQTCTVKVCAAVFIKKYFGIHYAYIWNILKENDVTVILFYSRCYKLKWNDATHMICFIWIWALAINRFAYANDDKMLFDYYILTQLTHLPLDKMAAVSLMTFSNALSWMKSFVFRFRFHWSLFLRVQLTITQHWHW